MDKTLVLIVALAVRHKVLINYLGRELPLRPVNNPGLIIGSREYFLGTRKGIRDTQLERLAFIFIDLKSD